MEQNTQNIPSGKFDVGYPSGQSPVTSGQILLERPATDSQQVTCKVYSRLYVASQVS